MSETELLPCPFCGWEAEMRRRIVKERNMFYVACKNEFGCVIGTTHLCDTIEEAIRRWNTRKPMERIIERLEEKLSDTIFEKATQECNESYVDGLSMGYAEAIDICKEEGGIE